MEKPKLSNELGDGLEAYCRYGNNEISQDAILEIVISVIQMLNHLNLTKLQYNVALQLIGMFAEYQTNTTEKEMEVCFG